MQKTEISLLALLFSEKVPFTFPVRRKGWPVPASTVFGISLWIKRSPKVWWGGETAKAMQLNGEVQPQLRWPSLFFWNRPGKKQEGTREILTEFTNTHFPCIMNPLISLARRGVSPTGLFSATALLFWRWPFWGGSCIMEEPTTGVQRQTQHAAGWASRASELWKTDRKLMLSTSNHRYCHLLHNTHSFCPVRCRTHTLGWPWCCSGQSAPLGFCLLPVISENSAWHLLLKKS